MSSEEEDEEIQKENAEHDEVDDGITPVESEEDEKQGNQLLCCIIIIVVFFVLGLIDSFTTKYAKQASMAFAKWTIENAPWSFALYCILIIILIACCLPYGPLSLLMGAIFTQLYGTQNGIILGILLLFLTTMVAAVLCFTLARYKFKDFVQRKINKSKKMRVLRNLDRLIVDGQGFEMVLLIRLAPIPTGPTQYFLGTTSVSWLDFIGGNACTNLLFSTTDILIGAGASSLKTDNPLGILIFAVCVLGFFGLMFYVGLRAKRKLDRLDAQETEKERRRSLDASNIEELDVQANE